MGCAASKSTQTSFDVSQLSEKERNEFALIQAGNCVTEDGRVLEWGSETIKTPTELDFFKGMKIKLLSCGNVITVAVSEDDKYFQWKRGTTPIEIKELEGIKPSILSCGSDFAILTTQDNRTFSWGNSSSGLGRGEVKRKEAGTPTEIPELNGVSVRLVSYGGSRSHTIIVTGDNKVLAWGQNSKGSLGVGDTQDKLTPTEVSGINGQDIKYIAAGSHSIAITNDDKVFVWGANVNYQLGLDHQNDAHTPTELKEELAGKKIKQVACGLDHSFALLDNGNLYTWGANGNGQLGTGDGTERSVPVGVFRGVKTIVCGPHQSFLATYDNRVYACGRNMSFELGFEEGKNKKEPTELAVLKGVKLRSLD